MMSKFSLFQNGILLVVAAVTGACSGLSEGSPERFGSVETELQAGVCVPPPDGIVAWWPGEADASDIVGDAEGTPQGDTAFGTGKVGGAFRFDGHRDLVTIAASKLPDLSSAISLDAWIEAGTFNLPIVPGETSDPNIYVVSKDTDTGRSYGLGVTDFDDPPPSGCGPGGAHAFMIAFTSAGAAMACSSVSLSPGVFYHIAGTYDSSSGVARIYVNGVQSGTAHVQAGSTLNSGLADVQIGARQYPTARAYFSGLIDEVDIFNRALSATEIKAIYDAGSAGKCKRKKVVILVQGIRTSLQCGSAGNCEPGDHQGSVESSAFAAIRSRLVTQGFVEGEDLLWFSYRGGRFDSASRRWLPNSYDCPATASSYVTQINNVRDMLNGIADETSDTDFYLVGHSQGGLIAFQSLGLLPTLSLANGARLRAVITLDSPLGGTHPVPTLLAASGCWGDPARGQLVSLYQSNPQRPLQQGDNARPLCRSLGACSGAPDRNYLLVHEAVEAHDVKVATYGNTTDGAYAGSVCHQSPLLTGPNNTATQIVSNADGGFRTGPDFYAVLGCGALLSQLPLVPQSRRAQLWLQWEACKLDCISRTHSWIRASAATEVADAIAAP